LENFFADYHFLDQASQSKNVVNMIWHEQTNKQFNKHGSKVGPLLIKHKFSDAEALKFKHFRFWRFPFRRFRFWRFSFLQKVSASGSASTFGSASSSAFPLDRYQTKFERNNLYHNSNSSFETEWKRKRHIFRCFCFHQKATDSGAA
jgi:hypothetical protein